MSQQPQKHDSPRISIVIPVYNGEPYVAQAIESALAQTEPPAEIAILDDASTDNTAAVLEKYRTHPLVRLHRLAERKIAPAAWNEAIRRSTSPYFVILAHDDLLHPDFLKITAKAIAESPDIGFVVTGYRVINTASEVIEERAIKTPRLLGRTRFENFFGQLVVTGGMYFCDTGSVVARNAFDKIGGFDERFKGGVYDYDFYLRLAAVTPTLGIGECLADYRVHETNMSASLHKDDKGDGDILFDKIPVFPGLTEQQKKDLARNVSEFQFHHFTRAARRKAATVEEILAARRKVQSRLEMWAGSVNPFAKYVYTAPPRLRPWLAWRLGSSALGVRLLKRLIRNHNQTSTWT